MTRHTFGLLAPLAAVLSSCAFIHWGYDDARAIAHVQFDGTPKVGRPARLNIWYLEGGTVSEDKVDAAVFLDSSSGIAWVSVVVRHATYFGPGYPKWNGCCSSVSVSFTPSAPGPLRVAARMPYHGPFSRESTVLTGAVLPATVDILIQVAP